MRKVFPFLLFIALSLSSCTYYFGNSWRIRPLPINATQNTATYNPHTEAQHQIAAHWASKKIPDWKTEGTSAARVALGKLIMQKDIADVNSYLANKKPWVKIGTDWAFNPNGYYDFTEVPLITILYFFW